MANDGNSSDNRLLKSITSGWKHNRGKWIQDPQKPPIITDKDDIHQTYLKKLVLKYYHLYHNSNKDYYRYNSKIITRMNQYRLKNWYWKAIN